MPQSGGIQELRDKLHARMTALRRGNRGSTGGDGEEAASRDELIEQRRRQRAELREKRRKETKEKIKREKEARGKQNKEAEAKEELKATMPLRDARRKSFKGRADDVQRSMFNRRRTSESLRAEAKVTKAAAN